MIQKAKIDSYCKETLEKGSLKFTIRYFANVHETGYGLINILGRSPGQIPLKARMNIRDNESKKQETLEKGREACGIAHLEFDLDWGENL